MNDPIDLERQLKVLLLERGLDASQVDALTARVVPLISCLQSQAQLGDTSEEFDGKFEALEKELAAFSLSVHDLLPSSPSTQSADDFDRACALVRECMSAFGTEDPLGKTGDWYLVEDQVVDPEMLLYIFRASLLQPALFASLQECMQRVGAPWILLLQLDDIVCGSRRWLARISARGAEMHEP